MVFSPFIKLIKGKETDDLRNRHMEHADSQGEVSIKRIDDSSDESVKSSGRTENGTNGYAWTVHPTTSVSPATIVAAPQFVRDYR